MSRRWHENHVNNSIRDKKWHDYKIIEFSGIWNSGHHFNVVKDNIGNSNEVAITNTVEVNVKAYSEHCQTSKMEFQST